MRFLCLFASTLWAVAVPLPRPIWRYFVAQIVYTIVLQLLLWQYGLTSPEYEICFSVLTGVILLTMVGICRSAVENNPTKWFVIIPAVGGSAVLTVIAYVHHHPVRFVEWVALATAALLTFCGVVLGQSSVYMKWPLNITLTLSLLWLLLGLFYYGWLLHPSPLWAKLNYIFPTWLCVAAFSWIAFSSAPKGRAV